MDTETTGFVRAGTDHSTSFSAFGVGAHYDRFSRPLGVVQLLHRGVERVHVHMDNNSFQIQIGFLAVGLPMPQGQDKEYIEPASSLPSKAFRLSSVNVLDPGVNAAAFRL